MSATETTTTAALISVTPPPKLTKPKQTLTTAETLAARSKTTEERGSDSRHELAEARRENKRQASIQARRAKAYPTQPARSSLAVAAAAEEDPVVMMNGAQVLDLQGKPITTSVLVSMITQLAQKRKESYEQTRQYLIANTDEQAFVNGFTSLLNNPSQAWQTQEQEISFENVTGGWGWEEEDDTSIGDMQP